MIYSLKTFVLMMVIFVVGWAPVYTYARPELRRLIGGRFVGAFAAMLLAAFFAPNPLLFFIALALILIFSVRTRNEAVCRYVQLIGLTPDINWQASVGSLYLTNISGISVLGFAALAAAKAYGPRPRGRTQWTAEDTTITVVFLILLTADRVFAFSNVTSFMRTVSGTAMLAVLPYWVLRTTVRDAQELRPVIACISATLVILTVFAFYEARSGWAIFDQFGFRLGVNGGMSKNVMIRGRFLRASGPMAGPLMLGCYMAFALTALLASARYFRRSSSFYILVAVGVFGLIIPQSRGSLLTFAVVIVFGAALLGKWGLASTLAIGGAVGGAALLAAAKFSTSVASFLNINTQPAAGDVYDYRQLLLHRGLEEAWSHPIFGLSLSEDLKHLADIQQGEHIVDLVNVYLTFFLTSGLVGMVPFLACLLITVARGIQSRRVRDRDLLRIRFFAVCALLTVLVEMAFMSFLGTMPYMLAMSLFATRIYAQAARSRRGRVLPGAVLGNTAGPEPDATRKIAPKFGVPAISRL